MAEIELRAAHAQVATARSVERIAEAMEKMAGQIEKIAELLTKNDKKPEEHKE